METKESQRWTAKRKVELLLQLIRGERKLVDVCREHDLKQSEVEGWMDTFVKAGERGLKARAEDEQAVHEAEVRELRAKIGELVYAWADGIYVRAGLEQEKAGRCRSSSGRCATGARKSWPSVPGYRESTDSWRGVLRGEGKIVLRRRVGAA